MRLGLSGLDNTNYQNYIYQQAKATAQDSNADFNNFISDRKNENIDSLQSTKETGTSSSRDLFIQAVQKFCDDNQVTAEELRQEKDWREMSAEEWDKMLESFDEYIEAFKERLKQMKEMQDEAAQKAASEADSSMRTIAASSAALSVAANGFSGIANDAESLSDEKILTEDGVNHENNWTKNLKTDDQTILRQAKAAQKMERDAMSKFQEVQLTNSTTAGISKTDTVAECATVDEDENEEEIWTVTAFTEDGIISKKFQNGKVIDSWTLKYNSAGDYEKVNQLISSFGEDEALNFAGDRKFWEEFLAGRTSRDDIVKEDDAWHWKA